ncbi:MAG TPA: hypothetical protein VE262_01945 [Blastocatellia bacterium]|nr:hypothetical protein [Blastocatellia bacterium]
MILLLALALYPSPGLSRQVGPSPIGIGGSIPDFVMISPPFGQSDVVTEKDGLEAVSLSSRPDQIIVRLENTNRSSTSSARLRIWIRTNTYYKVEASLLADAPEASVMLSPVTARPTGPGVVASALNLFAASSGRAQITTQPNKIAAGARISRGAISSASNAIELVLNVEVEQKSAAAKPVDILFRIEPA